MSIEPKRQVIVVGEALVDITERGGERVVHPGGVAANDVPFC